MVVKDNQATLKEDIVAVWEMEPLSSPQVSEAGSHGGRVERRSLWASTALVGYTDWPRLAQVCRMERTATSKKGGIRREVAYAITSLPPQEATPRQLLTLWRGHWKIENQLHWVRDVTFDEDRCQVRSGSAPQVLAALRNLVIGILHYQGKSNIAAALRRYSVHPSEAIALLNLNSEAGK